MQGFEPSIDLEFEIVFFKKVLNLNVLLESFSHLIEVVSAAKVGGTLSRPPRANLRQGHGDCICAMDSFDAFTIHP